MDNVRYNWLRDRNNKPVACIASLKSELNGNVHFALAVHNPKDNFSKAYGRFVALKRLEFSANSIFTGTVSGYFNVKLGLLRSLAKNKALPSRVREAAEYQLVVFRSRAAETLKANLEALNPALRGLGIYFELKEIK